MTGISLVSQAIRGRQFVSWISSVVGLVAVAVVTGGLATGGSSSRLALAGCLLLVTLGIWALRPGALLYLLVVWTVLLGGLRRFVSYEVGFSASSDPLLLIAPFAVILVAGAALWSGAAHPRTKLSQGVLVLTALIGLSALNPLQGSPTAGIASLIFFVPVAAFWAGRRIDDATLRRVLTLVALLVIPAALYGLAQLAYGFPPWDSEWINIQGYAALNVGGVFRQFSSFSSASEYAAFLAIGVVLWAWLRPGGAPRVLGFFILPPLVISLFYESARGIIFAIAATVGLLLAARRGVRLPVAAIFAAGMLMLLPLVVSHFAPATDPHANGVGALVSHQVSGLSDPTGSRSTLPGHVQLVLAGLYSAFTNPVGGGLSKVTIAGSKFGGQGGSTEADPSNVAIALGLPGLLVYLLIVWQGFSGAYRLAVVRRTALSFAALGLLSVTFVQWLNGGQYAVAYLPWLVLGWVDRNASESTVGQADSEPRNADAVPL
jgi:hypothetical protein